MPHADIGRIIDTPKNYAVTPGKTDVDHGSDAPDVSSVYGSAFREGNFLTGLLSSDGVPSDNTPDGTNGWDEIKGTKYESNWGSFVEDRNKARIDARKAKIDREEEDRKTLSAAPWYHALPAQIAAGVLDLPTLIPGGAFVASGRGGFAVARSAASVAGAAGVSSLAQEAGLHSQQETRTLMESGVNIGASVLLAGVLGASGAKVLTNAQWNDAVAKMHEDVARISSESASPASAGAAAVTPASIADMSIAGKAASAVAAASKKLSPVLRLLQSPSAAARETYLKAFENSIYLKMHTEGQTFGHAAETLAKEWNGGLVKAIEASDESFSSYVKGGGQLKRSEFNDAVGQAMRRGDDSDIPEVASAAKAWRAQVFEPLKNAAIEAKLLPKDVSVETAASYFSRMWNRNKLIAQEGRFKQVVRDWIDTQSPKWVAEFDRETIEGAAKLKDDKLRDYQTERRIERDARFGDPKQAGIDVADEVFNKLTGKVERGVRPEFSTVEARGPLKERTFNIPDALVEEFLEHDVDLVGRRYTRIMGADVELTNKFGSADMKEALDKVRADYKKLRTGIEDEKTLQKMDAAEKDDIKQLEGMRDLLRGTRNEQPIERNYGRLVRAANHVNYIRSMGEVVLASLTDAVRPAMVHGLGQFMQTIPQLAANMRGIKLSNAEARLAGNVAESVLQHRLATITDIMDPYASRGPTEAFLENMTNVASKWNGIRVWTDMMKSVASVMTQNRILNNVSNFGKLSKRENNYLAYLGIDESMAGRISKQFETHGEAVDGVKVANTEEWTDKNAVRAYRAAMNQDIDSIIVQKGVGDIHLFAQTPTGKALLQFKSFALASHQRVLLRGLQEDKSRFIGGTVAMTAMGMLITYLKALSGNRPETQERALNNPGWWIGEGLDRSGIFSVPMELSNVFERASGFNPLKSPLKMMDDTGNLSQKMQNRSMTGSLAGPTAGFIDDAATAASIPKTVLAGEETTKGQRSAAERLLPFNSYHGIRQMLRYLVNTD